ncbi:hypothetical protein KUW09_20080 [Mameliella alba]|nr:hypothetical protein [Antarctobacter heliothermus]MBY6146360.1 hypothetical protein [Mameliella alba]MCA0955759.1 hypothetical protein [Mameliella alba]
MMRTLGQMATGPIWAAALLLVLGLRPALAAQVELIVDRSASAVEVFFGMPAQTAVSAFGMAPGLLTDAEGEVHFEDFRQGTWDLGDALLQAVETRIGGQAARFEATSLMVHLQDQRLPFQTPLDGLTAISVCGVTAPDVPPRLNDLYLYSGFVSYPPDPRGGLEFAIPGISGQGLEVALTVYGTDGGVTRQDVWLAPGEALNVPATAPRRQGWLMGATAVIGLLAGLGLWRLGRRLPGLG